jgi:hypothetical protein
MTPFNFTPLLLFTATYDSSIYVLQERLNIGIANHSYCLLLPDPAGIIKNPVEDNPFGFSCWSDHPGLTL